MSFAQYYSKVTAGLSFKRVVLCWTVGRVGLGILIYKYAELQVIDAGYGWLI